MIGQRMRVFVGAVAVCILMSVGIGGCASVGESVDQLGSIRDQAAQIQSELQAQIDELALMRESIPDGSTQGDAIDALMAQVKAKLSVVEASVLHADQVIASVQNPDDPLTIGAKALSPWVPAPMQAPLVLGAALAATVLRTRSVNQGAQSIVESISHALKKDESFKAAFDANSDRIRAVQNPQAQKLVKKFAG